MKTTFKFGLAAIIAVAAVLSSCGKYEEGPAISFRTKKARMINEWKYEKSIDGSTGIEYPCTSTCSVLELKKDGTYSVDGTSIAGATWALSGDKEKLETTFTVFNVTTTTSDIILRLTNKELWLKDISNGDQDHYVAN